MTQIIRCDGCGQRYQVGSEQAGQAIRCRKCGHRWTVPGAKPKPAPHAAAVRPADVFGLDEEDDANPYDLAADATATPIAPGPQDLEMPAPRWPRGPQAERPTIRLEPAGLFSRAVATVIDLVLVGVVMVAGFLVGLRMVTRHPVGMTSAIAEIGIMMAVFVLAAVGLSPALSKSRASLGKRAIGLMVLDARSRRPTRFQAVLREAWKWSAVLLPVPFALGWLAGLLDDQNEAWQDRFSGTRVVRKR